MQNLVVYHCPFAANVGFSKRLQLHFEIVAQYWQYNKEHSFVPLNSPQYGKLAEEARPHHLYFLVHDHFCHPVHNITPYWYQEK